MESNRCTFATKENHSILIVNFLCREIFRDSLNFLSCKRSIFGVFFDHEMIFVILYPAIDFKTSRIPTVRNCVSRSREDDFIPHPASNFICIPHPATILSPIPHPAKPMLDPLWSVWLSKLSNQNHATSFVTKSVGANVWRSISAKSQSCNVTSNFTHQHRSLFCQH